MTRVLLDTSAYTLFLGGDPDVKSALQRADEVFLNAIVLGELLSGFRRGKRRRKNEQEFFPSR